MQACFTQDMPALPFGRRPAPVMETGRWRPVDQRGAV